MKLRNNINRDELARWFTYNYTCWVCNKNHADCFHHIMGRGEGDSKCERSILNAAPMNNFECHLPIHGKLRTEKNQKILLKKTMKYLLKQKYVFNELDKLFIEKYKSYYLES